MTKQPHYGTIAKLLHWLIVALLLVQAPLGWLMVQKALLEPGKAQNLHISFGFTILALIALRLAWRLTHPVAPEPALAPWQRRASEATHWLLYALVLAATLAGWTLASSRGWTLFYFGIVRLPLIVAETSAIGRVIGRLHVPLVLALIGVASLHVAAAFVFRDRVMHRMLPGQNAPRP